MTYRTPTLSLLLLFLCQSTVGETVKTVEFPRPDGVTLSGTWHPGPESDEPRPAVLLLHQARSDQSEFDFLLAGIHDLGFHALAVDLRGHGASHAGETLDREFFGRLFKDPSYAPPDVEAMLTWLRERPEVDGQRLAVGGGSVGANLSWVAAGRYDFVRAAVVLSGNADNARLLADADLHPSGVLLIAADKDFRRVDHARRMYEWAREPKRLEILEGSEAHGTFMLQESPELRQITLDWLAERLE